jgi:glycogen operon protein
MELDDWNAPDARALSFFVNGDAIGARDRYGQPIVDDSFYVMLVSGHTSVDFRVPERVGPGPWTVAVDTSLALAVGTCIVTVPDVLTLAAPAVRVLQSARPRMSLLPGPGL